MSLDFYFEAIILNRMEEKFVDQNLTGSEEELTLEGIKIKTIDMGGHADARRLWRDYLTGVNGVVFIVDAAVAHRLQ